jgi:hypothetical protein
MGGDARRRRRQTRNGWMRFGHARGRGEGGVVVQQLGPCTSRKSPRSKSRASSLGKSIWLAGFCSQWDCASLALRSAWSTTPRLSIIHLTLHLLTAMISGHTVGGSRKAWGKATAAVGQLLRLSLCLSCTISLSPLDSGYRISRLAACLCTREWSIHAPSMVHPHPPRYCATATLA